MAPAAALVAAAAVGEPLLAHWTDTFMGDAPNRGSIRRCCTASRRRALAPAVVTLLAVCGLVVAIVGALLALAAVIVLSLDLRVVLS